MRSDRGRRLGIALALTLAVGGIHCGGPGHGGDDAETFVARAEERFLEALVDSERAAWVQQTYITHDTELIAGRAEQRLIGTVVDLAGEARRYEGQALPGDLSRKLRLLKLALSKPAPDVPHLQDELTRISNSMQGRYSKGRHCPDAGDDCLTLDEMARVMAESRDPEELLDLWIGWRRISPPMRDEYARFVELVNDGARGLGFDDLGVMWRSRYDMPADEFAAEIERLWDQVQPLYESLHCYVRARLREAYGGELVPADGLIPAHLLGNMWAQEWSNIYDLVAPALADPGYDLTSLLRGRGLDALEMVRYGERFFTSLGFEPLPDTFWDRSMLTRPADREVVCHASAWDIDADDDLRIKMCIDVTAEDFVTIHHELGHNFYQRAYNDLSPLYRDGAHDGFHEGIGDTLALSITPEYLVQVGLLQRAPAAEGDLGRLLRQALDEVAFLPFGLLVDRWRWQVFAGEIADDDYNAAWWELRRRYQGVAPPVPRNERDFDPGAKYHIPFNTPYTRYFLAEILQFQFHRALCEAAGFQGPLHRCSIYGSAEAGRRLRAMMQLGSSRPWPDALETLTGERSMDATAILDYFAPLRAWLDEQNAGRTCGW